MRIDSIADHLDLVPTIARWHWDEWGHTDPTGSLAGWTENLHRFTNRARIPTMYVALDGQELIGSVTLNELDMHTHPELTPWLAGLFVTPSRRHEGVGSALVRHAMAGAAAMGETRLYLYTGSARPVYEKLGWRCIGEEHYEGGHKVIMAIDLSAEQSDLGVSHG